MVMDVALGTVFGALAAWVACVGVYEEWIRGERRPLRELPGRFWRVSLTIALVGAVLGGVAMWRGGLRS